MRGQRRLAVLTVVGAFFASAVVTFATCSGSEENGERGSAPAAVRAELS